MTTVLPLAVQYAMNPDNRISIQTLYDAEAEARLYDVSTFRQAHPNGCVTCLGSGWTEVDSSTGCSDYCPACIEEGHCPRCGSQNIHEVERRWYDAMQCDDCGYVSDN